MSHQFKPGDLALTLLPCEHLPAGWAVELIESVSDETPFKIFRASGDGWIVEFRCGSKAFFNSRYLMPGRGDFAPEKAESREVPA
jgi:hypothetical protein